MRNGEEEIDFNKLDICLHYGFDHEDEPDGDFDFRIHMTMTPHFNFDLPVIVIDESNGEYAAYANSFVIPELKLCYLEPLCTQPQYRRKGLAAAVIAEMMRRTKPLGADHMTGGSDIFYSKIGFDVVYIDEFWKKQ